MRHLAGKSSEYALYICRGLTQIKTKLRNAVKVSAIAHDPCKVGVSLRIVCIHGCPSTRLIARHYRAPILSQSVEAPFRASITKQCRCCFSPCFTIIFMILWQNSIEERARRRAGEPAGNDPAPRQPRRTWSTGRGRPGGLAGNTRKTVCTDILQERYQKRSLNGKDPLCV